MPELELKIRLIIDRCRYGEETILMDTKKAAQEIRLLFEEQKKEEPTQSSLHIP